MAGAKFQEIANQFVEQMERHAEKEQADTTSAARYSRLPAASTNPASAGGSSRKENVGDQSTTAVSPCRQEAEHMCGSAAKKARQSPHRSDLEGQGLQRDEGVRRVECPSLHVFQREYMETTTPVILTGVRNRCLFKLHFYHDAINI